MNRREIGMSYTLVANSTVSQTINVFVVYFVNYHNNNTTETRVYNGVFDLPRCLFDDMSNESLLDLENIITKEHIKKHSNLINWLQIVNWKVI
jgi:hypothetical protein